jgi:Disulphide bond corrector protein DsbC
MKSTVFLRVFSYTVFLSTALIACTSAPSMPIQLASFTENEVTVSINLGQPSSGNYILSATFTPPEGYHLYSKDIPIHGINGIGRPTLLELTKDSQLKAQAGLTANLPAENFYFEHNEFMVYPLGDVTLSLPIELPSGDHWAQDKLRITFMACSSTQCKPPVEGKMVPIRVPGANMFDD